MSTHRERHVNTKNASAEDVLQSQVNNLVTTISKQRDKANERAKHAEETVDRLRKERSKHVQEKDIFRRSQKVAEERAKKYAQRAAEAEDQMRGERIEKDKLRTQMHASKAILTKVELLRESEHSKRMAALEQAKRAEMKAKELGSKVAMLGRFCKQTEKGRVSYSLVSSDEEELERNVKEELQEGDDALGDSDYQSDGGSSGEESTSSSSSSPDDDADQIITKKKSTSGKTDGKTKVGTDRQLFV